MNAIALKLEMDICSGARHSWLKKAKELLKKGDSNYEFFTDLAEREQRTFEKLERMLRN
jgi:hypothetical protein